MGKNSSTNGVKRKLVRDKGRHEHISLKDFQNDTTIVPGKKQKGSGIYALYNGNKLYYVGLSVSSIRGRLRSHAKGSKKGVWDNFSFYLIPKKYLKHIETLLIHIADPPRNRQKGGFS